MNDKINLEDMTLAQIKKIKDELGGKIKDVVEGVIKDFQQSYDVGDIDLRMIRETGYERIKFEDVSYSNYLTKIDYYITIHFSKEDE